MSSPGHTLLLLLATTGLASALHAQPAAPAWTLTETLRLDANAEDFSVVGRILIGPHGQIAVPLAQDMQIRLYDSTGKRIGAVGSRGSGPGEFRNMLRFGWIADTLWVYDNSQRRVTYVAPPARVLRSVNMSPELVAFSGAGGDSGAVYSLVPNAVYADGSMAGLGTVVLGRGADNTVRTESQVLFVSPDGRAHRRVASRPAVDYMVPYSAGPSRGGSFAVPFVFQPHTTFASDGNRIAQLTTEITSRTGGTFTLTVIKVNGDTVFRRAYPFVGTPIPDRVADSAAAAIGASPAGVGAGLPRSIIDRVRSEARSRVPPVYAPVVSTLIGLDNTIWLRLRREGDSTPWLIIDEHGAAIGRVTMPSGYSIAQADRTTVWGTHTDSDGLASVVRFRVRR